MSTDSPINRYEEVPPGVRWLLLALTLGLAWLIVFQLFTMVPLCKRISDHLGVPTHGALKAAIDLLVMAWWLPHLVAVIVSVLAIVNRRSIRRLALLMTLAITANVGTLLMLMSALNKALSVRL